MMIVTLVVGTIVLGGLVAIYYMYKTTSRESTIPGLKPSHPENGNKEDIARAGSLHQFLLGLHREHGSIASFWRGKEFVVSIASADLFKEHARIFDRPVSLYKTFEPLLTPHSILFANGEDGRMRKSIYDPLYSHESIVQDHLPVFIKVTDASIRKLSNLPEGKPIQLEKMAYQISFSIICETSFGVLHSDLEELNKLKDLNTSCWEYMDKSTAGIVHDVKDEEDFRKGRDTFYAAIDGYIQNRKDVKDGTLLIDILLGSKLSDEIVAADAVTYLVVATHTTSLCMNINSSAKLIIQKHSK